MTASTRHVPGRTTRRSLIESLRSPDAGTRWTEFDQIYREIVMNIAIGTGLRHHDAEDVTQGVFEELAQRLTRFKLGERPGSFRRYLRRLVRWRSGTQHQKNRRHDAISLNGEDAPDMAAPTQEDAPDYEAIVTGAMLAMSRDLKMRDLQVLELVHCSHRSPEEVATALQISRQTVYQITSKHRERLEREILRRFRAEY